MNLPVVAVVGRPNVGKSTLVNRILGRQESIVEESSGVTRDRRAVKTEWLGYRFTLTDTGGWSVDNDALAAKVSAQAERAIHSADVVLFVVDTKVGPTSDDSAVAQLLRPMKVPVLVVANKVDHPSHTDLIWEFVGFGLGDPHPVSALHGSGIGDLLDTVVANLPNSTHTVSDATNTDTGSDDSVGTSGVSVNVGSAESPRDAKDGMDSVVDVDDPGGVSAFSVALVGRPNAGKSTLFNRLIGEDLAIVHDQPGTTRDSIDTLVETEIGLIKFVDTAGMRRRVRIDSGTEYYSLVRALRAVDTADVAFLVIDSSVGVTHQDQRLAERVNVAGCPIVVLLNKWDLLDTEARVRLGTDVQRKLGFLGQAPVLRVSALSGKGVTRLWPSLRVAMTEYRTRIPTRLVNDAVRSAQRTQPVPGGARILYATQVATDPPTFTLFTNRAIPSTYLRYIERKLRETFDLNVTAIKLRVRRRDE